MRKSFFERAVDAFLAKPGSRRAKWRLLLYFAWQDVRDYFLRWIYAQHNARVLADFETRMVSVIYEASGGLMSKPYYTVEAMLQLIRAHHSKLYDEGYADAKAEAGDE